MSKKYVAAKLKEYRGKNGIYIAEVVTKCSKSIKTIYAWESGQGQPDADTLIQLCIWYGINDFNVLCDKDFDTAPTQTPDQDELLQNYNSLNDMGKQSLLEQSRMMCKSNTYKKDDGHKFVPKNA